MTKESWCWVENKNGLGNDTHADSPIKNRKVTLIKTLKKQFDVPMLSLQCFHFLNTAFQNIGANPTPNFRTILDSFV